MDIADEKFERFFASFDSELLWALQPIINYSQELHPLRFLDGSLIVEPCVEGGVMLVAVSGHAMAVIRDPRGHASGSATLALPRALFDVCEPRMPLSMSYCGEQFELPVPEWMQPGTVFASSVGIFVQPKMRAPMFADEDDKFWPVLFDATECGKSHRVGSDYKFTAGPRVNWRAALSRATTGTIEETPIVSPEIVGMFSRIHGMLRLRAKNNPRVFHRHTKDSGPVLVQFEGFPDFIASYMQQEPADAPAYPTWFEKHFAPQAAATRTVQ